MIGMDMDENNQPIDCHNKRNLFVMPQRVTPLKQSRATFTQGPSATGYK
jgi:hypothetical protein